MPKIVDREAYRKQILDKCFHLFSRKGYAKVTMREIAAEVGVSTGTLYHYFPTKEKIQESLFAYIMESNVGEYFRRVEKTDSVAERLRIIADFWKEHGDYYQNVMLLAIDSFRSDADESSQEVFWAFSEYYTRAMGDRLGITERCARDLFIHLLGLVFHSILTPGNLHFSEEIDHLEKTLAGLIPHTNNTTASDRTCLEQLLAGRFNRENADETDR
jgi:AcrR family transcriptional regulator